MFHMIFCGNIGICIKKSFYPPHSRPELYSGREDLKMQGEGCPEHVHLSDLWQDDDGQDEDEETR